MLGGVLRNPDLECVKLCGAGDFSIFCPIVLLTNPCNHVQPVFKLVSVVDELEQDFMAFYEKGNKAAGTRIRKGLQDLKTMAQDIRPQTKCICADRGAIF